MGKQVSVMSGAGDLSLGAKWRAAANVDLSIARALLPVGGARSHGRFWLKAAVYVPLVMAAFEIPWFCIVGFAHVFLGGSIWTFSQTPHLGLIAAGPAGIGFLFGLVIMWRDVVEGLVSRMLLCAGLFACALCLFSVGGEFFR